MEERQKKEKRAQDKEEELSESNKLSDSAHAITAFQGNLGLASSSKLNKIIFFKKKYATFLLN